MVKKSGAWSIRIDEIPGVTREVINEWCIKHKAVLCVREETDEETPNPHYHIALRCEEVSQETARNWTKKAFGDSPFSRSDFATATWDGDDKLLKYFCKGSGWKAKTPGPLPDIVYTTLLPMTVQSLHSEFWAENSRKGDRVKSAKGKSPEMLDECYNHVKAMKLSNWYDAVHAVTCYLLEQYGAKINDHVLFPMVQSVMYRLDKPGIAKDVTERMIKKFGPRLSMCLSQTNSIRPEDLISHEYV